MTEFIKVQEGISASVGHEVTNAESADHYLSDQISRLDKDNHILMSELCAFALSRSNNLDPNDPRFKEKVRIWMVTAGIVVYRMLESQFESDELAKQWEQ